MKVAIYARYSSDVQKVSTEDQMRKCEELAFMPGFQSLITDALKSQRPFDCILVDGTSRIGRNLADILPLRHAADNGRNR